MIYYELSDLYKENVDILELNDLLKAKTYIKFYAFILHDKTLNVKPHYHCLIQVDLNNKKAKSRIEKDFKSIKPFVKCCRSPKGFARYLTHKDYMDKEQYSDNLVITNNRDMYNDLIKIELKISKIEQLLKLYYGFVLDRAVKGYPLTRLEIYKWWLDVGQGNYFLTHAKNILEVSNIIDYENEALIEMERSENINYDSVSNNMCDYSVNSLFEIKN